MWIKPSVLHIKSWFEGKQLTFTLKDQEPVYPRLWLGALQMATHTHMQ